MSEEQIQEARERLSITVEGETSTSVPLESFDDMVCLTLLLWTVSVVSCCPQCMGIGLVDKLANCDSIRS